MSKAAGLLIATAVTGCLVYQLWTGTIIPSADDDVWIFEKPSHLNRWETPIRFWITIVTEVLVCGFFWYALFAGE